ncbi:hypothetical protein DM860_009242 [Cuscuta australis]|uniref:Glycine-rich protein n=1 Tax=Cuscuta australis TaxID=267555 RepID=A0A328DAI4_9ASTE|nr:hypothetical protein DM860_009242 [Cuscuta australis]
MSCFTIKSFLSAYPPIPSCQSAFPARKSGFPVSLILNKLSSADLVAMLPKLSLNVAASTSTYKRSAHVCLFGGKTKSGNGNDAAPGDTVENLMGSVNKGQSIEDVLRQQIKSQEFYDGGGSGTGKGGFGGGGGGGKFGKDGSGGPDGEDISEALDEAMQVVLATLGFVFLYIYILDGPEINRYTKDIIRCLLGGKKSFRLQRLEEAWESDWKKIWTKRRRVNPRWLEPLIMRTRTLYSAPTSFRKLFRGSGGVDYEERSTEVKKKARDVFDGERGTEEKKKKKVRDVFDEEREVRDGFDEDVGYRCDN